MVGGMVEGKEGKRVGSDGGEGARGRRVSGMREKEGESGGKMQRERQTK